MKELSRLAISTTELAIEHLSSKDERLAKVIESIGFINTTVFDDSFRFLVHTVIEQMMSKKVTARIEDRLLDLCGGEITPCGISQKHPSELRSIGISKRKSEVIVSLAQRYDESVFSELKELPDDAVINQITAMPGFGPWSAKMYLIFVLGREDVLPYEDGAFLQSYKWLYNARSLKPSTIKRRCGCWKPYSSVAARYLYHALDTGLTKIPLETFLNGAATHS